MLFIYNMYTGRLKRGIYKKYKSKSKLENNFKGIIIFGRFRQDYFSARKFVLQLGLGLRRWTKATIIYQTRLLLGMALVGTGILSIISVDLLGLFLRLIMAWRDCA